MQVQFLVLFPGVEQVSTPKHINFGQSWNFTGFVALYYTGDGFEFLN